MATKCGEDEQLVAAELSAAYWRKLSGKLDDTQMSRKWDQAYEFLQQRLQTRYITPIRTLMEINPKQGEGFSIVSLQCALIEFLAALRIGKRYVPEKYLKYNNHSYSRSGDIFISFLEQQEPFSKIFRDNVGLAGEFYDRVRCGLLHEAMTKHPWRINDRGENPIDADRRIIYRDRLQDLLECYINEIYYDMLTTNAETRCNLKRKMDFLINQPALAAK